MSLNVGVDQQSSDLKSTIKNGPFSILATRASGGTGLNL